MSGTLSPRDKQLARLIASGHSQVEAARLVSVHKSTVCRLMRDEAFLQEVQRLQAAADRDLATSLPGIPEKIREGAQEGADVLRQILADERNDAEMLRLKANVALELLSRAGYSPIKQVKVEQATISTHLTMEEIEEIKQRARARMTARG